MMHKKILVTQTMMPKREAVEGMLDSFWESKYVTNCGPYHQDLEAKLAKMLDAKHFSMFSNGTLGLMLGMKAMDLQGEVIVTPFTFPATVTAIEWCNLKPVFCDIEEDTMCLDPKAIEAAITSKTAAILGVHVYGIPCDVKAIQKIADQHDLKVIYDAAHAFQSTIDGIPIAHYGDATMFSFHATKLFNTIEGGGMVYKDATLKEKTDQLKNFGLVDGVSQSSGINAKMNEVQAIFGLANLDVLDAEHHKRRQVIQIYDAYFKDVKGIKTYSHLMNSDQYYPITIDLNITGFNRDELIQYLNDKDIYPRKYFYPLCSDYSYIKDQIDYDLHLPVAEKIVGNVLCMPFYGELLGPDLDRILAELNEFRSTL